MRLSTCSATGKCRIRRIKSCRRISIRRSRDLSVRIPIPNWWTPRLGCQLLLVKPFKVRRAKVSEGRMAPAPVIERFDVFKNRAACGGPR